MRLICALMVWFTFNVLAIDFSTINLKHDIEYVDGMVVSNFVSSKEPDILLVGRDASKQKQLQVIALKDDKVDGNSSFVTNLDKNILFYQKAKLANHSHQVMLFLLPGQVAYFDMQSKSVKTLVQTNSIYRNSHALNSKINPMQFALDINNDELTDLIIADFEQTYIYVQRKDGSFTAAQKLNMLAQRRTFEYTGTEYVSAELMVNDFNNDGENDIVYRYNNDLYIFTQKQGLFSAKPIVQNLGLSHPLDNRYDQFSEDQSNLTTHTFFNMSDLNADGRMDIITQVTKSAGLLDKSSSYRVYMGQQGEQLTEFPSDPSATISSDGLQFELKLVDFNGDGNLDIVSPSYKLGVGSIIASLFSSSADLDIAFHPMIEGKSYNTKPITEKEITVDFDLSSGQQVYPLLILADFNDDGSKDLLTGHGGKKLYLRPAQSGKRVFSRRAEKFKIKLPRDGRLISAAKFNDDEKTDLIVRYDRLDGKELSSQIKVLLTR